VINRLFTLDRIILYRDRFSLGGYSSFPSFLDALDEENYSPYVLLIERTSQTNVYHLEFEYVFDPFLDRPPMAGWNFINESTLRYFEDKGEVSLEATIGTGWLFFYLLLWGVFIALTLYAFIVTGKMLTLLGIVIFTAPLLLLYKRDKHLYQRIRSLANKHL
jgi:hypothetical protein